MAQRPLGGTKRKAIKVSGFRARMKTQSGRNIIRLLLWQEIICLPTAVRRTRRL